MNAGALFLAIALVLFLFAWVGVTVIPAPLAGGLFCLTLAQLLGNVSFSARR